MIRQLEEKRCIPNFRWRQIVSVSVYQLIRLIAKILKKFF